MTLEMTGICPHDVAEQDVAAQADGLCPLCLLATTTRLRQALHEIDAIAVTKKAGAALKMQRVARVALRQGEPR